VSKNEDVDIARNIKIIEWLKTDLITSISALFRALLRGSEDRMLDALASLVLTCYVLSRRLGISFSRLDLKMEAKLRQGIEEGHEVEKANGDLSRLLGYLVEKKR
jgi:hypothetical protein